MAPVLIVLLAQVLLIVTSAKEAVHGALLMVHRNTLLPVPSPVTVVLGLAGLLMMPVPDTLLHIPVPFDGVLPESVVAVLQIV